MEKPSITASAVINFAEKLEEDSSRFYEELAKRYGQSKDLFLSFAKESIDNKIFVSRTYRETITDAIEACFSFKGLNLNDYKFETTLAEGTSYSDALRKAMELEEKASKFWLDIAEQSASLLATIPRAFRKVAEKRSNRKMKIKSLFKSS